MRTKKETILCIFWRMLFDSEGDHHDRHQMHLLSEDIYTIIVMNKGISVNTFLYACGNNTKGGVCDFNAVFLEEGIVKYGTGIIARTQAAAIPRMRMVVKERFV